MALEIRVHKDFMQYQSKVMWGMTWRQIALVGAVGIPAFGLYALCVWLGAPDVGQWILIVVAVPVVLFGWIRPKGLMFEQYARYVLNSYQQTNRLPYVTVSCENAEISRSQKTKKGPENEARR